MSPPDAQRAGDITPQPSTKSDVHHSHGNENQSNTGKRRGNYLTRWNDAIWAADLTPTEKLVALAHGKHADYKTGHNCRPGASLIAAETGLAERSVKRARLSLEAKGWLVLVNRGGTKKGPGRYASLYRLGLASGDSVSPHTGDTESTYRCHSVPPPTQTTKRPRTATPYGVAGGACEVCENGNDVHGEQCVSCGRPKAVAA